MVVILWTFSAPGLNIRLRLPKSREFVHFFANTVLFQVKGLMSSPKKVRDYHPFAPSTPGFWGEGWGEGKNDFFAFIQAWGLRSGRTSMGVYSGPE
jgi:hypothetical protein